MKVDIEKLRLGVLAMSETIAIGIPNKDGISLECKKDVTSDFLRAVIDWAGSERIIRSSNGDRFKISVEELKKKEEIPDQVRDDG